MGITDMKAAFNAKYGEEAAAFFSQFPKVITWGAMSPDNVLVTHVTKYGIMSDSGALIFDENGEIESFASANGRITLKRAKKNLSEEMLVAQISAMLTDSESASRYCEQVSMTLLEEDDCVFNAPIGLHMKPQEFKTRYHSSEWLNAWQEALMKEFHAKAATYDEAVGVGCVHLYAL